MQMLMIYLYQKVFLLPKKVTNTLSVTEINTKLSHSV